MKKENIYKKSMHVVLATITILLVPLIAMQFTSEVVWTIMDFVVAGGILLGFGLLYVKVTNNMKSIKKKFIVGGIFLAVLFVIWVQLAVGII